MKQTIFRLNHAFQPDEYVRYWLNNLVPQRCSLDRKDYQYDKLWRGGPSNTLALHQTACGFQLTEYSPIPREGTRQQQMPDPPLCYKFPNNDVQSHDEDESDAQPSEEQCPMGHDGDQKVKQNKSSYTSYQYKEGKKRGLAVTHDRNLPSLHPPYRNTRGPTIVTTQESPSHKYARRKRHKTRSDKYKLKSGIKQSKHSEHSKGKRRTRRNVKKTGSMLKEEFDAPNVEVDRVTLRQIAGPSSSRHENGLASVEFCDLPDLTFPTMDFYSRRKKLNDNVEPHKAIDRSIQQAQIQAISDYFSSHRDDSRQNRETTKFCKEPYVSKLTSTHFGQGYVFDSDVEGGHTGQDSITHNPTSTGLVTEHTARGIVEDVSTRSQITANRGSSPTSWEQTLTHNPFTSLTHPTLPALRECGNETQNLWPTVPSISTSRMEDYTRQALIRVQPGFWRNCEEIGKADSVHSISDLRALMEHIGSDISSREFSDKTLQHESCPHRNGGDTSKHIEEISHSQFSIRSNTPFGALSFVPISDDCRLGNEKGSLKPETLYGYGSLPHDDCTRRIPPSDSQNFQTRTSDALQSSIQSDPSIWSDTKPYEKGINPKDIIDCTLQDRDAQLTLSARTHPYCKSALVFPQTQLDGRAPSQCPYTSDDLEVVLNMQVDAWQCNSVPFASNHDRTFTTSDEPESYTPEQRHTQGVLDGMISKEQSSKGFDNEDILQRGHWNMTQIQNKSRMEYFCGQQYTDGLEATGIKETMPVIARSEVESPFLGFTRPYRLY